MAKIRYEFADGTISEVEVSERVFSVHAELETQARRGEKRETRRHVSIEYMREFGAEIEDSGNTPLFLFIRNEEAEEARKFFSVLTPDQRELLERVYIDGESMADIAREQGVAHSTVKTKVYRAVERLKKLLQK